MEDFNIIDDDLEPKPPEESDDFETEPDEEPLLYDDDDLNLAEVFEAHPEGRIALKELSSLILDNFQNDWDSSEKYRERMSSDWAIFSGELPEKDFPFPDSANPNVPIMLETVTRLSFRMMGEIFGDWNSIVGAIPVGAEDREGAEAVTKHSNWQFREQIHDFPRQMDRAVLAYLVWGDVTCHSYYDPDSRTNRHEILTPDEFVIPHVHTATAPDCSDLPHYTKIMFRYRHELESKIGEWMNVEKVIDGEPPEWDDDPSPVMSMDVADSTGIEPGEASGTMPYKILHYEGWLMLPNQARERWCKVIIDHASTNIMHLTIHEEPDWRDQVRFDSEMLELQAYESAMMEWENSVLDKESQVDAARAAAEQATDVEPEVKSAMLGDVEAIPLAPEPMPPRWMEESENGMPAPVHRVPVRMFTRTVCIENMVGASGMSLGRIQADFNRASNVMMSQFIDAATLANCWSLLTTTDVSFPEGMKFTPGSVTKVEGVSGTDLRQNIMEMRPSPANPQLMQAVENLYQWAQSSAQAPNVLSGESGKSGETYRGLSSRLEQATKQLSVVAQKFVNTFLKRIIECNSRLNSIFLEEEEFLAISDPREMTASTMRISRHMYRRGYSFVFRADLRFASEAQRIQEATELLQLPQLFPPLAANAAFMYEAIKRLLEARKDYDLIPLLGEPPPPQPAFMPPQQPMPQGQPGQPPQG